MLLNSTKKMKKVVLRYRGIIVVEEELEKNASTSLSVIGEKTDLKYQNIEVIDSTIM